jgi:hypothetical protein
MPTKVGTHDKFQRGGICCGFPMREEVLYCALPWIPASAGMTVEMAGSGAGVRRSVGMHRP